MELIDDRQGMKITGGQPGAIRKQLWLRLRREQEWRLPEELEKEFCVKMQGYKAG